MMKSATSMWFGFSEIYFVVRLSAPQLVPGTLVLLGAAES